MSIYVYAPTIYPGTRELIDVLQAKRLIRHDGMYFLHKGTPLEFGPQDAIVCWGGHVPPIPNIPCLNASYTYNNMLQLNLKGLSKLDSAGYSVFQTCVIKPSEYANGLALLKGEWWPLKPTPARRYVPFTEFVGYGTTYHNFKSVSRTLVFKGKEIAGDVKVGLFDVVGKLDMDFAAIYSGQYNGNTYILKLLTAPPLDAKEVKIVADSISTWAKNALSPKKPEFSLE